LSKLWIAAYALVATAGVVRVASTHRVFSEVIDEPAHIICGFEWLTGQPYLSDPSHPPLERALSAIPSVLQRVAPSQDSSLVARGNSILYWNDRYEHNLAYARLGNLALFIIGMIAVAWWGHRAFGAAAGLLAMAMFASLPPILGQAGVATTDLAVAVTFTLALLTLDRWLEAPTFPRATLLGLCVGLGILSKFSFLLFFPIAAVILCISRISRRTAVISWRSLCVAALTVVLVVWAGYRFSFSTVAQVRPDATVFVETAAPNALRPLAKWLAMNVPVPAPEVFLGMSVVRVHDLSGHRDFLLGRYSTTGWWYYFPVLFFYKTPIAFILLAAAGIFLSMRTKPEVALIPIALMIAVMPSSINIGIRHLLPIYPPLCIAAASASIESLRGTRALRIVTICLLGWFFIGVGVAHPDYLAWFNGLAGGHPERIAVDSNLDWGQDILRLGRFAREHHLQRAAFLCVASADVTRHGLPAIDPLPSFAPYHGWIAVSETALAIDARARAGEYRWLDAYQPVGRIGKSIRVYYVP